MKSPSFYTFCSHFVLCEKVKFIAGKWEPMINDLLKLRVLALSLHLRLKDKTWDILLSKVRTKLFNKFNKPRSQNYRHYNCSYDGFWLNAIGCKQGLLFVVLYFSTRSEKREINEGIPKKRKINTIFVSDST